jgi:hypothetical protein
MTDDHIIPIWNAGVVLHIEGTVDDVGTMFDDLFHYGMSPDAAYRAVREWVETADNATLLYDVRE